MSAGRIWLAYQQCDVAGEGKYSPAELTDISVTRDPKLKAEIAVRTGRTSVPQIFVGDTHVGGFDDLYALDKSGGLDKLLAEQQA